jgi:hypothetical protein
MKATENKSSASTHEAAEGVTSVAGSLTDSFSFGGFTFSQIWLILFMLIILVL